MSINTEKENEVLLNRIGIIVESYNQKSKDLVQKKTEKVRIEEENEELNRHQRDLLAFIGAIPDVVVKIDHHLDLIEIKPEGISPMRLAQELNGGVTSIYDLPLPDKVKEQVEVAVSSALKTKETQSFNCTIQTYTRIRYFECRFNPITDNQVIGIIRDVTQREHSILESKRHQAELAKSNERFDLAVSASNEGIWDWDIENKTIFFSDRLHNLLGLSSGELKKRKDFRKLIHPDDRNEYDTIYNEHLKKKTKFRVEHRLKMRSGMYKWFYSKGEVIFRNGKAVRMLGTITDIDESKRKEQEIVKLAETLRTKNQHLEEFSGILSHNLRSPIANITTLIDFLDEDASIESNKEILSNILKVGKNLSETFNELLDIIKIQRSYDQRRILLSFDVTVNKVIENLKGEIMKHDISIITDFSKASHVFYPKMYLDSILHNLISNAIKYHSPERKSYVKVETFLEDDCTVLKVQDNGLGLNLEKFGEHIFKMHKTFHNNVNAKGVGLYITKSQIVSMGGKIEVESKEDEGATFTVHFGDY